MTVQLTPKQRAFLRWLSKSLDGCREMDRTSRGLVVCKPLPGYLIGEHKLTDAGKAALKEIGE